MGKFFVVNFNDGFDITDRLERVNKVISNFGGVEVHVVDNPWLAYKHACMRHTAKKFLNNFFAIENLPKFEDVMKTPFYERMVPINSSRFFALVASGYHAAISTNFTDVINFLHGCHFPVVKEFISYEAALMWVNHIFLLPICSMSAYLKGNVQLIDALDNKISHLPYSDWINKNCDLPPEKRFTPENCVEPSQEGEYILPLELVELPPPN